MKKMSADRILWGIAIFIVMIIAVMPTVYPTYEETKSVALEKNTGSPNLQVITLKYDPFPVNPGEYVDVWLKLGNEDARDITDLSFQLEQNFPFSMDPGEDSSRNYGKILANSMVLVHYKVRVSEDAVEGDNYLKYRYRYVESDLKWIEGQVKIRVQSREAVLNVESVTAEPSIIPPGKEAYITIKLKNLATSVIRDVMFKLDLSMSTVAKNPSTLAPTSVLVDSYYNAIPLVPINSSTEKMIGYIKPGEEKEITYKVRAYPDAKSKTYKVPVRITYKDEVGGNYTKDDVIGLTIGSEPDIDVFISEDTVYSARSNGDITVKLVNKGVTDIKFLNVVLKPSEKYDLISANTVYVGDVDSDDYETADFKLYVKKLDKDDRLSLLLHIEYQDSNGIDYSRDIPLELTAYSMKHRGLAGSSKAGIVVFIIILMAAGWYGYKRWEKSKKKKKGQ